jgi:carbamoyl-phosphate synthase small subunit
MSLASPALLALEDGSVFRGTSFGAAGTATGEVCFNTSMTGYQEVVTDPSYCGQIVAMTAPHIGNTGVALDDDQSARPWVAGLVTRAAPGYYSSWRAQSSLHDYLARHGVAAVADIDTRRLTRHLRARGAMRGALSSAIVDVDELVDVARSSPRYEGRDLVRAVTTSAAYEWPASPSGASSSRRVAAFDFGVKRNLLDQLALCGCDVTVVPATTTADTVLASGFDGVFLSNGPGDPSAIDYAVLTARALLGRIPMFGICLGHQVLARALGADTFKLPFGHRGGNHPVACVDRRAVEITCQNHGFAVDRGSLSATGARLTHINLNDHTVEGLEVRGAAFAVQYHPESGPGPHDSRYLFGRFVELMDRFEPRDAAASEERVKRARVSA